MNLAAVPDTYPLLQLDYCIDSLGNASLFTTLDLNCGYWQISVDEVEKDKTCFITHGGRITTSGCRSGYGMLRNVSAALDLFKG